MDNPNKTIKFPIISRNNHLVNYYSESIYYHSMIIQYISMTIGILSFIIIIFGIFTGTMNIVF
jgi:hypothetical protein